MNNQKTTYHIIYNFLTKRGFLGHIIPVLACNIWQIVQEKYSLDPFGFAEKFNFSHILYATIIIPMSVDCFLLIWKLNHLCVSEN